MNQTGHSPHLDSPVLRLLVVEDDLVYREAEMRHLLRGREGWEVVGVGNLRDAEAALARDGAMVVLLDLGLPDARGTEGITRLRRFHPECPVIVVTGEDETVAQVEALGAGAQEYLVKGAFDGSALRRAVTAARARMGPLCEAFRAARLLSSVLDGFEAAVGLLNSEGRLLHVNAFWERVSDGNPFVEGVPLGRNYKSLCELLGNGPHLETAVVGKGILAVLEGRLPIFRVEYPAASDPQRWFGLTATRLQHGGVPFVTLAVREVTDRIQTMAELRRNQRFFQIITDYGTDLLGILDPGGRLLYSSPSFERDLGWVRAEVEGMDPLDLVHPGDREPFKEALGEAFRSNAGTRLMFRLRHKAGNYRTFEAQPVPVEDPHGRKEAMLLAARDITERLEAEAEKERMKSALLSARRLESAIQMASSLLHEVNTPVQSIDDNVRFLQESFEELLLTLGRHRSLLADVAAGEPVSGLQDAAARLLEDPSLEALVAEVPKAARKALEAVGKVEEATEVLKNFVPPPEVRPVPMDVNRAVRTAVAMARTHWHHPVAVDLNLAEDLPHVPGYPGEFNQVLLDLVGRAVAALRSDAGQGRLRIRTCREGNSIRVELEEEAPCAVAAGPSVAEEADLGLVRAVLDKHRGTLVRHFASAGGTVTVLALPL